jgi:CheY-like chemotaxis protein
VPDAPTVAVVEDNADNRLLLRALLGDRYAIVEYETGAEALAGFARQLPEIVLLDISLPGMNGVEVLERIRADRRLQALPVIALTAHAMTGDREEYLAAGFDDYVAKPIVDERVLLRAIERFVARRG